MATTISTKDHTGNGTLIKFDFNFPPIKTEDVKVALNGATLATTKYTFPTATEIQFNALGGSPSTLETNTQESNGAPKSGVKVLIYRDTDVSAAKAVFASGSAFRAIDLNNNQDQNLYAEQEIGDTANPKNKATTHNGTGVPSNTLGKEGDIYIDTTNDNIYGPKTNGVWGSATTLIGATGATGAAGPTGAAGATGATGPAGPTGATGAAGADGNDGATGATGPQGPAGPTGATGAAGADGNDGATGATGAQGPAGPQGATGAQGPQGATGATGAAGADGSDATVNTTNVTAAGAAMLTGAAFTGHITLADDIHAKFGASEDLIIGHSSADNYSYILEDNTTGSLRIKAEDLLLEDTSGDNYLYAKHDEGVLIYYDNVIKFQTKTNGVEITGTVDISGAIDENVFAITDGNAAIDPDNGTIQTWTLGANRTASDSVTAGQSVLLMITAGAHTLTWPTITWAGGSAPTLSTSSTTAIEIWKVGSTLYGANVGDV